MAALDSYFWGMKRAMALFLILTGPLAYGQGTASPSSQQDLQESINILSGKVRDLQDGSTAVEKRLSELQSRVSEVSAQASKPKGDYATQDDIKALKAAIEAVDKKRQSDNEEIVKALKDLAKASKIPTPGPAATHLTTHTAAPDNASTPAPPPPDGPGFTYLVKSNDTLVKISKKLFNEQHVKVSVDDMLKANAFLKGEAKNLKEGDKLFIPTPKAP